MPLYNIINDCIKYKKVKNIPLNTKCGDKRTRHSYASSNELPSSFWACIAETWKEGRWNATQTEDSQMN